MSDLLTLINEPTSPYDRAPFQEAMDLVYVRARLGDAYARLHLIVACPAADANPAQASSRHAQMGGIRRDLTAMLNMLKEE